MTTRLLVGDVFHRMAELPDHSFDLIVTSPPFLALRSYLPDDHPDKALEIGSEATPAAYLDTLLALTAEWRRLLAPHGSIAVELGDTYAGSGGAGGDYDDDGLRAGQPHFDGSATKHRRHAGRNEWEAQHPISFDGSRSGRAPSGEGWPLPKSLTGIPTLYTWSLAYGRNLLTGQPSPAGRWRIRNLKSWIRSNPPVGALGDKERPATSYITVACTGGSRWFDLDAVRTPATTPDTRADVRYPRQMNGRLGTDGENNLSANGNNPGGAPPLDWWHPVDAVIDNVIDQRAGKPSTGGPIGKKRKALLAGGWADGVGGTENYEGPGGARGVHVRRALEAAGYLQPDGFYDVSPKGYAGAHYAVWPPELVRLLVDEMCPRRVCTQCGVPSRRIVGEATYVKGNGEQHGGDEEWRHGRGGEVTGMGSIAPTSLTRQAPTLGWSDCGCAVTPTVYDPDTKVGASRSPRPEADHGSGSQGGTLGAPLPSKWRPGRILDPFSGSGTTLAVASGMGRDSVGIDLDQASYGLTRGRVGPLVWAMEFSIDWPAPNWDAPVLPRADGDYAEWAHMLGEAGRLAAEEALEDKGGPWWLGPPQRDQMAARYERRNGRRPVVNVPGQGGLFTDEAMA